ncbi:MAG: ParB N-terminal domain-containing protein, partial [Oscillospiraceae bacterium]|nr:ParB N-terminal domain-containing protein [Oscillospiraceae bacterium]
PKVMDGEVKLISITMLRPFAKHSFALYQGERLDDMVQSIKKNGVIVPIIARTIENSDKFEIISGHNRVYASGLAGLEKVPVVIKTDISDEIAQIMAIESNLIQRGFSDLKISEQAFAVALRYKKLFDEKKLEAINEELRALENGNICENESGAPVVPQPMGRKKTIVADDYGISHMTVTRLIRINELCDELKDLVDIGNISIRAAVHISYLSIEDQKMLFDCMSKIGKATLDMNTAWEIRELYKSTKELTPGMIEQILSGSNALSVRMDRTNRIALDREVFERYFKGVPKKEVVGIVEKALEMYFKAERA